MVILTEHYKVQTDWFMKVYSLLHTAALPLTYLPGTYEIHTSIPLVRVL